MTYGGASRRHRRRSASNSNQENCRVFACCIFACWWIVAHQTCCVPRGGRHGIVHSFDNHLTHSFIQIHDRSRAAGAFIGRKLYIAGGANAGNKLNTVEELFDASSGTREIFPDMKKEKK